MQGRHIYEYAIIRLVPRVDREEFINIGVILFSKNARYIRVQFHIDSPKHLGFFATIDENFLKENLKAFKNIAYGTAESGKIGEENLPERFRWLTATRSSIIQTSKVHSGTTKDLDATFQTIFAEQIL